MRHINETKYKKCYHMIRLALYAHIIYPSNEPEKEYWDELKSFVKEQVIVRITVTGLALPCTTCRFSFTCM